MKLRAKRTTSARTHHLFFKRADVGDTHRTDKDDSKDVHSLVLCSPECNDGVHSQLAQEALRFESRSPRGVHERFVLKVQASKRLENPRLFVFQHPGVKFVDTPNGESRQERDCQTVHDHDTRHPGVPLVLVTVQVHSEVNHIQITILDLDVREKHE